MFFFHRNMVQNELLKKQVAVLQKQLIDTNETYLENRRLENLVSFKQESPYKLVAARLIGTSADSWSSIVIIDRGKTSGIRQGFVAISHLGLVGRVIETQVSTSKVMLLTDPAISVSAIVQRSRQEGLVSGTLGNNLIMRYLPVDADIKINDTIISSGLTEAYPKGLFIGTVTEIGNEFSGLSRFATVKPAVALSDLEEMLIIIP